MQNSVANHERIIEPPAQFPVNWEIPGDAELLWTPDRMHFPVPVSPMLGVIYRRVMENGMNRAAEAYDVPVRFRIRRINGYIYMALTPADGSADNLREQARLCEENLRTVFPRMGHIWQTEFLPEIEHHFQRFEAFNLKDESLTELLIHMNESLAVLMRLYEIHFLNWFPYIASCSMLEDFYAEAFGNERLAAYGLLQGFDSKTLEADTALWRLSRKVLENPKLRATLEQADTTTVIESLRHSAEGRAFQTRLHNWLKKYGYRASGFMALRDTYWIDDPAEPLRYLAQFLQQPERAELIDAAERAAQRESAIGQVECRIKGAGNGPATEFELLLNAAQEAVVLQDENNFWADGRGIYGLRRLLMEIGMRFAQGGAIEEPEDIFFLEKAEVRDAAGRLANCNLKSVVEERKAEFERFGGMVPPPAIGTVPLVSLPDSMIARALERFFGPGRIDQTDERLLRGNPGSPGKIAGPARIVRSTSETGDVRTGEIVVATTTTPAWTPLFATAAALVTETGGSLCPSAANARLYGIPAVVGTTLATSLIQDGQQIEVDGGAGTVRIL